MKKFVLLFLFFSFNINSNLSSYTKNNNSQARHQAHIVLKDMSRLEQVIQQIDNFEDRKIVINLYQNFNSVRSCDLELESTSIKSCMIEVVKQLTSPSAIRSVALVAMSLVFKGIITSDQFYAIIHEISIVAQQMISLQKLNITGGIITWLFQVVGLAISGGKFA